MYLQCDRSVRTTVTTNEKKKLIYYPVFLLCKTVFADSLLIFTLFFAAYKVSASVHFNNKKKRYLNDFCLRMGLLNSSLDGWSKNVCYLVVYIKQYRAIQVPTSVYLVLFTRDCLLQLQFKFIKIYIKVSYFCAYSPHPTAHFNSKLR